MSVPRPYDRYAYLWLAVGGVISLFSGGRWIIPLAVWLAPVFLLRFVRVQTPVRGYVLVWLVRSAAAAITLQGIIPAPTVLYYPLVLVLSLISTLPYLSDRILARRLPGFLATLAFPAAYTTIEYLGSLGPFGSFPSVANTQYGDLPLMQLAAVTGISGITFLITWLASMTNWVWERGFASPGVRRGKLVYVAIVAGVLLGGGARLALFSPQGAETRVAGVSAPQAALSAQDQQLSMESTMALTSGQGTAAQRSQARTVYAAVTEDLFTRTQKEAQAGARIVVWPEAGASVLEEDESALIQRAADLARQEGIYLDLGLAVILRNPPAGGPGVRDEAVPLDQTGKVVSTYEKTHLVPFEETGLIVPGDGKVPEIDSPLGRLANVICFDLDFPGMIRQAGQAGADLMLAPSNDWKEVDPIHTEAATFRAIEDGFSLVRQGSHGLAATVDYEGRVLAASDFFTTDQQVMVAYVPMHGVRTIYSVIGDLFAWLCLIGLAALVGLAVIRGRSIRSAAVGAEPPAGAELPGRAA